MVHRVAIGDESRHRERAVAKRGGAPARFLGRSEPLEKEGREGNEPHEVRAHVGRGRKEKETLHVGVFGAERDGDVAARRKAREPHAVAFLLQTVLFAAHDALPGFARRARDHVLGLRAVAGQEDGANEDAVFGQALRRVEKGPGAFAQTVRKEDGPSVGVFGAHLPGRVPVDFRLMIRRGEAPVAGDHRAGFLDVFGETRGRLLLDGDGRRTAAREREEERQSAGKKARSGKGHGRIFLEKDCWKQYRGAVPGKDCSILSISERFLRDSASPFASLRHDFLTRRILPHPRNRTAFTMICARFVQRKNKHPCLPFTPT